MLAQAARVQAELETLFGNFLRAHPLLAPLGDKKNVKYVVWSVLAAPLLALLLPALLLPVRVLLNPKLSEHSWKHDTYLGESSIWFEESLRRRCWRCCSPRCCCRCECAF